MAEKTRKIFQSRKFTLKKKAGELSTLCKSQVCIVCYDPNGELDVWPEDSAKAHSIITNYYSTQKSCLNRKRENTKLNLSHVLEKKISKLEHQVTTHHHHSDKERFSLLSPLWDEQLDTLSPDSLVGLSQCLEAKIQTLDQKLELLKGKQQLISQTQIQNQFEEHYYSLPQLPVLSHEVLFSETQNQFDGYQDGFPVHGLEDWIY